MDRLIDGHSEREVKRERRGLERERISKKGKATKTGEQCLGQVSRRSRPLLGSLGGQAVSCCLLLLWAGGQTPLVERAQAGGGGGGVG